MADNDMTGYAKILGHASNAAVVQLPYRKYPGLLIQGDTLCALKNRAEEALNLLSTGDLSELREIVQGLQETLNRMCEVYNATVEDGH